MCNFTVYKTLNQPGASLQWAWREGRYTSVYHCVDEVSLGRGEKHIQQAQYWDPVNQVNILCSCRLVRDLTGPFWVASQGRGQLHSASIPAAPGELRVLPCALPVEQVSTDNVVGTAGCFELQLLVCGSLHHYRCLISFTHSLNWLPDHLPDCSSTSSGVHCPPLPCPPTRMLP